MLVRILPHLTSISVCNHGNQSTIVPVRTAIFKYLCPKMKRMCYCSWTTKHSFVHTKRCMSCQTLLIGVLLYENSKEYFYSSFSFRLVSSLSSSEQICIKFAFRYIFLFIYIISNQNLQSYELICWRKSCDALWWRGEALPQWEDRYNVRCENMHMYYGMMCRVRLTICLASELSMSSVSEEMPTYVKFSFVYKVGRECS
jgi:hypothetical protein